MLINYLLVNENIKLMIMNNKLKESNDSFANEIAKSDQSLKDFLEKEANKQLITYLKKLRKELEKWLNIPHVIKLNKELNKEIIIKNTRCDFLEVNNKKLNEQVMELKNKLKDNNIK